MTELYLGKQDEMNKTETLFGETKDEMNKTETSHIQLGIPHLIKMVTLLQLNYKFNKNPIRIVMGYFIKCYEMG